MLIYLCILTCVLQISLSLSDELAKANGFNDNIKWVTLDKGLQIAKTENKPLMLLIHKSWCSACKALKPKFVTSEKIEKLSKKFVMVNTMDDDEPEDDKYSPDGKYVPRILFLSPDGKVQEDIINENGNPEYNYYYSVADSGKYR
ncbi:hypothetical protein NP493_315g01024 [Ridgeia piscesae]|uniref:Thioredoxin domain-containing protein n=1 Tax=Ridgeia piscesae TaxID=27915 RepID=A0AAD9L5N0_RIDPI|nr:hypothetical protein NP493_315g01024 [Ridgeia piscesae]